MTRGCRWPEVQQVLAQGAHTQFGDLPWTARSEMLAMQWILARPEIRDFLQNQSSPMYEEGWIPQVDAIKRLNGWRNVSVTHLRGLGVYAEPILLSLRYSREMEHETEAKNWARYWRPEIQGYLHAYGAVTAK